MVRSMLSLLRKRRWRGGGRRSGAVAVEAALVLPMVVLFLIATMEYAHYLMILQLLNNAAREGAAYAAKHTDPIVVGGTTYGNATSDVTNLVTLRMAGQQLGGQNISVYLSDSVGTNLGTWTSAQAGQYICVQITGTYSFIAPKLIFLPTTVATTVQAVKRSEGN
jgi:Flp pilus assembly protein TadG